MTGQEPTESESASGSLPPAAVRSVMRSQESRMRHCYELRSRRPEAAGEVTVSVVVGTGGRVDRATASTDVAVLQDAELFRCMQVVARALRFPEPSGGGSAEASYPWVFAP
ncbi:MAG: AgmX/PglI C-terminal domain-containing protein [Sandaracinaceae bacterium]